MDENRISFIICYNNDYYLEEAKVYISELNVPDGYSVDIIEVLGAKSMTSGCNEGMHKTNAKYKIYMHQDVFITNKNFLNDMLIVFQNDKQIGLIGMVGTPFLCKDATMWHGIRFGGFYKINEYLQKSLVKHFYPIEDGVMEVEAVDGLLMATQYDVPWREDIFDKWDFYDVSQSFEFMKAGWKVVVPGQNPEWYIHDCGVINLNNYNEERDKFLQEYSSFMSNRKNMKWKEYLQNVKCKVQNGYNGSEESKKKINQIFDDLQEE